MSFRFGENNILYYLEFLICFGFRVWSLEFIAIDKMSL
jgi:hypothetical protein